jgi:hypothetical protein
VATVLNAPVLAVVTEDLLGGCFFGCFAGDTVCNNPRISLVFSICDSFYFESLGNMGKVQAVIEFGGNPDLSGLVPAVIGLIFGCVVRIPPNIIEK